MQVFSEIAVLKNFAVEKSVALGFYHALEIKADRRQDFHAFKLHYISPGSGIDFVDCTFSEGQMLNFDYYLVSFATRIL